jgi:hypothetical protein
LDGGPLLGERDAIGFGAETEEKLLYSAMVGTRL